MSVDIFVYAPIADVVTIPFDDLVIRLSEAGFTCKVEPETENMIWITFDNLDSSICRLRDRWPVPVFGTLHASLTEESWRFRCGACTCRDARLWLLRK